MSELTGGAQGAAGFAFTSVGVIGKPSNGMLFHRFHFPVAEIWDLSNSYFDAGLAATSSSVITVRLGSNTISMVLDLSAGTLTYLVKVFGGSFVSRGVAYSGLSGAFYFACNTANGAQFTIVDSTGW
jgi:hypothetical protein